MSNIKISGLVRANGEYKNLVLREGQFMNKDVKEILYSTDYGDVESLFGFTDLHIIEADEDSDTIKAVSQYLDESPDVDAVICLDDGFLIVYDIVFFSGYTKINGVDKPYTSWVEYNTYEGDEASDIIDNDVRLS